MSDFENKKQMRNITTIPASLRSSYESDFKDAARASILKKESTLINDTASMDQVPIIIKQEFFIKDQFGLRKRNDISPSR